MVIARHEQSKDDMRSKFDTTFERIAELIA